MLLLFFSELGAIRNMKVETIGEQQQKCYAKCVRSVFCYN